jgi:hypothetical protein
MSAISYHNRRFRLLSSSTGAPAQTIFHYHQDGDVVWGHFSGGSVRYGSFIALADASGVLDLRYQFVDVNSEIVTGTCITTPEILPDGRLRLYEDFQMTCRDFARGQSIVEEVREGRG